MDILFIHGNYPAQFRQLAPAIANKGENRVIFLTERKDAGKEPIEGVQIRNFSCHRNASNETHHYVKSTEESVLKGQAVIREVANLIKEGFKPRIVISHAGMGLGLFIKDLIPDTLHVGYFEWYFRKNTTKYLLKTFDLDEQLRSGLRNIPILQELDRCDIGVVPTEWQKRQFPHEYNEKLKVIFDGIDTSFFHPQSYEKSAYRKNIEIKNRESGKAFNIKSGSKVLSYATRGMEPLRGFPEFMRSIPYLLEKDPDLQIIIAGADRSAYSYEAPNQNGSWKDFMLEELGPFKGEQRVLFTGLLNYTDYRRLLWRTDLHCYLTHPYVTSWSLFESASCGAYLAISRNEATENIVEEKSVVWLDLAKPKALSKSLNTTLNDSSKPRSKILPGYDLNKALSDWGELLNQGIQIRPD